MLIDSVDRLAFNAVGMATTTFSETHVDSGDFYSADKGHFHFFGD
jgi:hypothetical protein